VAIFLLIWWKQFPLQRRDAIGIDLLASPFTGATCFVLCASVPSRTGSTGAQICIERGVGGIVIFTPVAVEVWMSSWWNDRGHVGSRRGSRAPVHCARSRLSYQREWVPRLGALVAPHLARGLHMFLGRGRSTPRGSGALMTSWGLGRGGNCRPRRLSRPRPLRKARAGWRLTLRFE
jgi:hypothetical protein